MASPCARCGTFASVTSSIEIGGARYCATCAARPEVRFPQRPWREAGQYAAWALAGALLAYIVLNPLCALLAIPVSIAARALYRRIRGPATGREVPTYAWSLVAASVMPPVALFFVLNRARPDLWQPLLDHLFGYLLVAVEALLLVGAAGSVLLAARLGKGRPAPIVGTWIAGLILCVFPAIFGVMFGPIAFALMFGEMVPGP